MEAHALLLELDHALDELRVARGRLAGLPTRRSDEDIRVSAAVWEQAQRALINAQAKVELAQSEIRRLLAHQQ